MPIPTVPVASLSKKKLSQAARFHGLAGSGGSEIQEARNTGGASAGHTSLAEKSCGGCGVSSENMLTCGACGKATYCSKECQRAAWPGHKGLCKEVVKSMNNYSGPDCMKGINKWHKINQGLICQAASQELWKKGICNTHGLVMQLEVVDDKMRVNEVYAKELPEIDRLLARDNPAPKPADHMLVAFFATAIKGNVVGITKMTYTYTGGSDENSIPMPELIARMNA